MKNNLVTRKITSLLLSGALVSMLAGSVSANTLEDTNLNLALRSQEAVASVSGGEVSQEIKEYCLSNGVEISEDSLVEILPLTTQKQQRERSAPSQVLAVTNRAGDQVQKDILVSYEKVEDKQRGTVEMEVMNISPAVLMPPFTREGHEVIYDWDRDFTIKATAVYNRYSDPSDLFGVKKFYQPLGCYFFLYKVSPDVDVSYCGVMYSCEGILHTYPGFENTHELYTYEAKVIANNPKTSEMYSTTKALRSDRTINISTGSPGVGQDMTFEYIWNGVRDGATLPIVIRE